MVVFPVFWSSFVSMDAPPSTRIGNQTLSSASIWMSRVPGRCPAGTAGSSNSLNWCVFGSSMPTTWWLSSPYHRLPFESTAMSCETATFRG